MSQWSLRSVLAVVVLVCLPALSQQITVVKIGVPLPSSRRDQSSAKQTRDEVVRQLNRHQIDHKRNIAMQAIALESAPGSQAIEECRSKKCDFLLYLRVEAVEQSVAMVKESDGATGNKEVDTALVEYQLRRAADGVTVAIGMAKSDRSASRTEAILDTVWEIPGKVAEDIGNASDQGLPKSERGQGSVAAGDWGGQPTAAREQPKQAPPSASTRRGSALSDQHLPVCPRLAFEHTSCSIFPERLSPAV